MPRRNRIIRIRASSLPTLFDCAARWVEIHVYGRTVPSTPKSLLGKAIHAGTAAYDGSVLRGEGLTIDEAEAAAVSEIYEPKEEVLWEDNDFTSPQQVEKVARALHRKYCKEVAPQQNYVAVEVTVNSLRLDDLGIELTGQTDRIYADDEGNAGIKDLKSGKQAVIRAPDGRMVAKTQGHAAQMGVYELIAEFGSGIPIRAPAEIIGMQTGYTAQGQHIATGLIHDARSTLVGDDNVPGMLEIAAMVAHGEIPAWGNPKSMFCSPKYCPAHATCKWRR